MVADIYLQCSHYHHYDFRFFNAIDRLALFAVPLLILFLIYVSNLSLGEVGFADILAIDGEDPDYFSTAVSTMIGSLIVGGGF